MTAQRGHFERYRPELIGEYEPLPEAGTWRCMACDALARAEGFRASAGVVLDRQVHTAWHNKVAGT